MTVALRDTLAKAGLRVDEEEFLALVEEAASRLAPANPVPAQYFTVSQREALTEAGLDLSPQREGEPDARARSVAAHAVLANSALTATAAARTLGVDASRIRHKLSAGRLAGWKDHSGWRLPAWQFTDCGTLPGLDVVLAAVPGDQPALVVAAFMTTPQDDLLIGDERVSPREWLLAGGDPAPAAALASTLGMAP
ncbi:MAG TPA: DNA-binding protein [Amycolatopsis sp.]|nr:DNA-binding protein [Amycolatopsis sp.]